jgi:hypothetical protein
MNEWALISSLFLLVLFVEDREGRAREFPHLLAHPLPSPSAATNRKQERDRREYGVEGQ